MKGFILVLLVFFLAFGVSAYESLDSYEEDLRFELLSYDPTPILPGSDFETTIQVTNIGEKNVEGLTIRFGDSYPIFLESESEVDIGFLEPGERNTFNVEFRVNEFARETGELIYQYTRKGFDRTGAGVFDIEISDINKDIEFDAIRTVPEKIGPGQKGKIIVDFQNSAPNTLNEITLTLNITDPFTISGTTNERRISSLAAKEKEKISFDVVVDPNAEPGIYTLPLDISYYDSLRNLFSKQVSVGILVDSEPDYEIFVEESDALQYGSTPEITLAFSNTGTSDIKFLTLELLDNKHYSVVSNPKTYLGNLEPDDFETARFKVNLKGCSFCPSKIPFKIRLNFKDSFNNDIVEETEVYEKAYSKGQAVSLGLAEGGSGLGNLIVFILVISFIYLAYKEYRKTKDIVYSLRNALRELVIGILRLGVNIARRLKWRYIKRIPMKMIAFLHKLK